MPLKDTGRYAHQHSPPKLLVREAGRAGVEGAGIVNLNVTEKRKFLSIKTDEHSKPDSSTDGFSQWSLETFPTFYFNHGEMEWFLLHISLKAATPDYIHTLKTSNIYYTVQALLQTVLLQIEMPVKMDKEKWKISELQV